MDDQTATNMAESSSSNVRKSTRVTVPATVPHRIVNLFHHTESEPPVISRKLQRINTNPSVYKVNDFLTEAELDYLDRNVSQHAQHFTASFIEDDNGDKQIVEERTSTYIFLEKGRDNMVRSIESRAADLVSLSPDFVEPLQIVNYTEGQKFELHHDAGTMTEDGSVEIVPPKRLVTLFVYLNNLPEGQGCTHFPALNLSITPKRGMGVLFCNVLPSGEADPRTSHRACPVDGGLVKYGMNVWITDSSMLNMGQIESTIPTKTAGISREEFAEMKQNCTSKLAQAERLTATYSSGFKSSRDPLGITDWDRSHPSVGRGVAAVFEMVEDDIDDDLEGGRDSAKGNGSSGASSRGGSRNGPTVRTKIYNETFQGVATGYAPSTAEALKAGGCDEVYEIKWEDGELLYYSRAEYYAGIALFAKLNSGEEGKDGSDGLCEEDDGNCSDGSLCITQPVVGDADYGKDVESKPVNGGRGGGRGGVGRSLVGFQPTGNPAGNGSSSVSGGSATGVTAAGAGAGAGAANDDDDEMERIPSIYWSSIAPASAAPPPAPVTKAGKAGKIGKVGKVGKTGLIASSRAADSHAALADEVGDVEDPPAHASRPSRAGAGKGDKAVPVGPDATHALSAGGAGAVGTGLNPNKRALDSAGGAGGTEGAAKRGRPVSTHKAPSKDTHPFGDGTVGVRTVLRWKEKAGTHDGVPSVECFLGLSEDATPAEVAQMELVVEGCGKLLCFYCVKSIQANRKAVSNHLTARKHIAREEAMYVDGAQELAEKRAFLMNREVSSFVDLVVPGFAVGVGNPSMAKAPGAPSPTQAPIVPLAPRVPSPKPASVAPTPLAPGELPPIVFKDQDLLEYTHATDIAAIKTALKWREYTDMNMNHVLGGSYQSPPEEMQRFKEILEAYGRVICLVCMQKVSASKKSVTKHQQSAKHATHLEAFQCGLRRTPTYEQIMRACGGQPGPLSRTVDLSNALPRPSVDASGAVIAPFGFPISSGGGASSAVSYDAASVGGLTITSSVSLAPSSSSSSSSSYSSYWTVNGKTAATKEGDRDRTDRADVVTVKTVDRWKAQGLFRDLRYVLGCGEGCPADEVEFYESALARYGKLFCLACEKMFTANRKVAAKHMNCQRHMETVAEIEGGLRLPCAASVFMSQSIEATALSNAAVRLGADEEDDEEGGNAERWGGGKGPERGGGASVDSQARVALSFTEVLSWRGVTGIDLEHILGGGMDATQWEVDRANECVLVGGKVVCRVCTTYITASKKSIRRHQNQSLTHTRLRQSVESGVSDLQPKEVCMNLPLPPPLSATGEAYTSRGTTRLSPMPLPIGSGGLLHQETESAHVHAPEPGSSGLDAFCMDAYSSSSFARPSSSWQAGSSSSSLHNAADLVADSDSGSDG